MVADVAFLVLTVLATLLLWGTFGYSVYLGVLSRRTRTGRILFGTISSLKLWVLIILGDFFVAALWPWWVSAHRQEIRWVLVVYLLGQTLGSFVALNRLHRKGETLDAPRS